MASLGKKFPIEGHMIWTMNDFAAYVMLSGWSIHERFTYLICMSSSTTFRPKNGGKSTWFDCHRQRGSSIQEE